MQVNVEGIARPLSLVVDTAAGASVLDLATAHQALLGIDLLGATPVHIAAGAAAVCLGARG
ncbi:hypothetical protein [Xanthomonas maliensis]|uniref:hypothetical protein n=1 Tax=Xanthomonas maliensis TaxID=1321368 RepID=UPI0003A89654|nr:hypothetical protein [Xanthomonas maliensis]KAB7771076.1 hypothetical protein CKY51_03680 [Xanthomonas maliensis]